jgi:hypothetical protein
MSEKPFSIIAVLAPLMAGIGISFSPNSEFDCVIYIYALVLIRSNKMQQYAGIYLLQVYSTCFGRPWRPSSGAQKTVTAASGTGHSNGATAFLQRGLIRLRWRKVVAPLLLPVPEAAVTVFCSPDDGRDGRPKHVE